MIHIFSFYIIDVIAEEIKNSTLTFDLGVNYFIVNKMFKCRRQYRSKILTTNKYERNLQSSHTKKMIMKFETFSFMKALSTDGKSS